MNALDAFQNLLDEQREEYAEHHRITLDGHECGWRLESDGSWTYMGPIFLDRHRFDTSTALGRVEHRKDGRYNYWRHPNKWRRDWAAGRTSQGVIRTLSEAKLKVEEGWT